MSAYTPDDPEQLTYEEMESERDRLAMELYHSQIEAKQLRAERDALLPVVEAARDAKTAIEIAPVGPGAGKLMTLLDAVDALQPTEGAQS